MGFWDEGRVKGCQERKGGSGLGGLENNVNRLEVMARKRFVKGFGKAVDL